MNKDISNDFITEIINNHINTTQFQNNFNNIITTTLINKKNTNLSRDKIAEKISNSDFIKDTENDLMTKILKNYEIEEYHDFNAIKIKDKNLKNKNSKQNHNFDIESNKLLNFLIDEILTINDLSKIENFLGDLVKFDPELLCKNEKMGDLLKKTQVLLSNISNEIVNIPNLLALFIKISKGNNIKVLIEAILVFVEYNLKIVEKFYKNTFDITNFYNIYFNIECLNNMLMKVYGEGIIIKRLDENKIKLLVGKFFDLIVFNYEQNNLVYLEYTDKDFGISTNYILTLFFLIDPDLSILKIIFRNPMMRKQIKSNYFKFDSLIFIDYNSCYASIKEKYSFLWKHPGILEQINPDNKFTKKTLLYIWFSIKINFLGLMLRYKLFRDQFYMIKNVNTCFEHFNNLISFLNMLFEEDTKNMVVDFEESSKENMYFLIKEVACDFVLYCTDDSCLRNKFTILNNYYNNKKVKKEKIFKALIEDVFMAFDENMFFSK